MWLDLFRKFLTTNPEVEIVVAPDPELEKQRDLEDRILEFMGTTGWDSLREVSHNSIHPIIHRLLKDIEFQPEEVEAFPDASKLHRQIASCVAREIADQIKADAKGKMPQMAYDQTIQQIGFSILLAFQVQKVWNGNEAIDIP